MNRLQLFRLLRRNVKLSEKRNPAFEQGMVAKVLKYIGAAVVAAYMIFLGSMFGAMAADSDEPSIILLLLLVLLAFDFLGRFMTQQTPMVFIKPYMLMPIPAKTVVESYLLTILTSGYNFLWLSLLLPYAYICIVAGVGFWPVFETHYHALEHL